MVSALLLISFVIHIVLFVAVGLLWKQVQTLQMNKPEEITDMLESYLDEIKEENRLLQTQMKTENISNEEKTKQPEESPREQMTSTASSEDDSHEQTNTFDDEHDVALSFEANVLYLYSQGYTEEEIARKLNRGKTEVMLIVKFHGDHKY